MPKQKQDTADSQRSANTPQPVIETVLQMHTLMASFYERFVEVQHETASLAIAEIFAYQRELLRAIGATAQFPWPHMHQQNELKFVEVTRAWFELATQAQAAMVQVLRESVLGRVEGEPPVVGRELGAFFDRRRKSVVINFPERRAASS